MTLATALQRMKPAAGGPAIVVPLRRELGALVCEVAARERPAIRSYPTEFVDLNRLLGGGISTRQLTTVMGPPGAGKTAWAVALALHLQAQVSVLYVSTELESHELMARIVGTKLDKPWRDIVRGHVDPDVVKTALDGVRIRIIGCDELPRNETSMDAIAHTARTMAEQFDAPPLIIIDYIQDLARGTEEKNLRAKMGDIATVLRAMAQKLDCPMVGVSSVSRAYYSARRAEELRSAQDATVYLAAAKESGDVDYASAVVLFLDVEPAVEKQAHRLAQVAVAKSRHGETGFSGARFFPAAGRWQSDTRAVAALQDGERNTAAREARNLEALAEAKLKVLEKVRKLKSKPVTPDGRSQLLSRSELSTSCGVQKTRAVNAIAELVGEGKLVERVEAFTVPNPKTSVAHAKSRNVIDLPSDVATVPV